jgi:hypothetical protein
VLKIALPVERLSCAEVIHQANLHDQRIPLTSFFLWSLCVLQAVKKCVLNILCNQKSLVALGATSTLQVAPHDPSLRTHMGHPETCTKLDRDNGRPDLSSIGLSTRPAYLTCESEAYCGLYNV